MRKLPNPRLIIDRRPLVHLLDELAAQTSGELGGKRARLLAALKTALSDGKAEVRRRFVDNASGAEAVAGNAFLMDQLIRVAHEFATECAFPLANPTASERLSLVAVGGYGREELAPESDVDLLFLQPYKTVPHNEQVIEVILYLLWDLGLKVGHAVRGLEECLTRAAADHTIATSVLEARHVCGDRHVFTELRRRFLAEVAAGKDVEFVEAKLGERDARHARVGDSRYVLEPNVKDGKGGLRDLHTLFWIAKYLYRVDDIDALEQRGLLTARELRTFVKAQDFLWTVRCQLHYLTGRPEDRLTFDLQPEISRRLGYADRAASRGVERFMKHYYLVVKSVGTLTRIICAGLEAERKRKPRFRISRLLSRKRNLEPFVLDGDRLGIPDKTTLTEDPVNVIRLFHVAQENGLDIHPSALKLITRNRALVGNRLRGDAAANDLFLRILTSEHDPETALRRMNDAGVLGRFVPDFGRVVAQTQHDMYHVYTVDEHTIRAIGLLHRIEQGRLSDDHPVCTEIVGKVLSRRVLYMAVLLHDVAKGRGGDHSVLGAEIATELGPRVGLSDEETENVAWLVRHHLAMSATSQRRDLADPKTVADFVALVRSPERLRLLLVLTVVDMRATGPNVWNGWKAALLRDLYHAAVDQMTLAESTGPADGIQRRAEEAKAALRDRLSDWSAEEFERYAARGYPGYWLSLDTDVLARHAPLLRQAEAGGRTVAVGHHVEPDRAVTEVSVFAPDRRGLFSRIAGAMAASGADIVDARIFTMTDGTALDVFWIQDVNHGPFDGADRLARLSRRIELAAGGDAPIPPATATRRFSRRLIQALNVAPRVLIDNKASATHTVIEVNALDRPGLLHDVTRALSELDLQIFTAKISTYGETAVDVFYVKNAFGLKVEHEAKLAEIRAHVGAALAVPDGEHGGDAEPAAGAPPEVPPDRAYAAGAGE